MIYAHTLTPRPVEVGGGWRLRLLEDGEEVGGGVFPPADLADPEEALQAAFDDAEAEAEAWLSSRPQV
jgi:hypothetical protein